MKETELRVGNYILDTFNGRITCVNWQEISWIQEGTDRYKPIELTEEILLKCGFSKSYTKGVFKLGDFTIDVYSKTWKFKREWIDINFKYLHQLQNLYFALTGQELEIKL